MLCINRNFQAIEVELDAKAVIDVLSNLNQANNNILSILDDCKQLVSQIFRVQFSQCYGEANKCTDLLARRGTQQTKDFCLFDSPPMDIASYLDFDYSGMYLNRRCPANSVSLF